MDTVTDKRPDFDLSAIDAADEGRMEVLAGGKPTGWYWIFAGPGHPKAIEQKKRVAREVLNKAALQEQSQVNRKKWQADKKTLDDVTQENVDFVMERLLGWTEVKLDGQLYPFSDENARKILSDPRKVQLLNQSVDYVSDDNSFTRPSASS